MNMNYLQFKKGICDRIDSVLAGYWSSAGLPIQRKPGRPPKGIGGSQVQRNSGGVYRGFGHRNYGNRSQWRDRRNSRRNAGLTRSFDEL